MTDARRVCFAAAAVAALGLAIRARSDGRAIASQARFQRA